MPIEELGRADRHAVAALWEATGLTRPWNDPLDDFDRAVNGPTSAVLGLRDGGGRLIATVMVGTDGHRGWLYYLAVDPRSRSQGMGRRMVQAAEGRLRSAGVAKVQLMVRDANDEAVGFYEHLDYADAQVRVLARWLTPPPQGSGG